MRRHSGPRHHRTDRGTAPIAVPTTCSAIGSSTQQQFWAAPRRPSTRPGTATTPKEGTTMHINHEPVEALEVTG